MLFGFFGDYRFRPQLVAGMNYLNMFNNNSPFGFSNLISPDLGTRIKFFRDENMTYIIDIRYMPLIMPVDLLHRGFTLGFSLSYLLPNQHRVELGLAYSDYFYYPDQTNSILAQMYSIKLGYGL
jgi:hypothetical protein